ncbi:MAG: hypothetical protein Salg2KO_15330 [Salibacteraceae bacterium]
MERIDEERDDQNTTFKAEFTDQTINTKRKNAYRKKSFFGLAVLAFGIWWLLRRMDIEIVPDWVLTWPVLLIAIGVFNLIAHQFRSAGGYILVLIGSIFLARNVFDIPFTIEPYFWPAVVIVIGLIMVFKPRGNHRERWKKKRNRGKRERFNLDQTETGGDKLDSLVVMGGVSKDVISKDFQGGEMTVALGGADINFSKADIVETATLDVTIVAGGVKLVLPNNWDLKINTTNIMGAVDDKRRTLPPTEANTKTLILKGTVVLGGIEITGYA